MEYSKNLGINIKKIQVFIFALSMPFVGANIPYVLGYVNQLQLFDLGRLWLVLIFFCSFPRVLIFFRNFKALFVILFVLTFSEFLAILLRHGEGKDSFLSIFNFPASYIYYIIFPCVVIDYVFNKFPIEMRCNISRKVMHLANIVVAIVCLFQLNSLFDFLSPVSYLYNNHLFYIFEGRWGGWVSFGIKNEFADLANMSFLYNILSSPIVTNIKRLSGTFQEPSLLAVYCSLMIMPLLLAYVEGSRKYKFPCYKLVIFSAPVIIFFSFSSTGFLILACNLLFLLFFTLFKKNNFMFIILIFFTLFILIVTSPILYEKLYVFEKLISVEDESSSTRYGSIYAALKMLLDYPLGVGYGAHPELLHQYIPEWGMSAENSKERVALHSTLLRIIVDFGLFGIGCVLYLLANFHSLLKRIPERDNALFAKYFIINVMIISVSDLPFNEVWLIFIFYVIFKIFTLPKFENLR